MQHGRHLCINIVFRKFPFSYDRQLNFIQDFSLPNTKKEQDLETFVVEVETFHSQRLRQRILLESRGWRTRLLLGILRCTQRPLKGISAQGVNSAGVEQCSVK